MPWHPSFASREFPLCARMVSSDILRVITIGTQRYLAFRVCILGNLKHYSECSAVGEILKVCAACTESWAEPCSGRRGCRVYIFHLTLFGFSNTGILRFLLHWTAHTFVFERYMNSACDEDNRFYLQIALRRKRGTNIP